MFRQDRFAIVQTSSVCKPSFVSEILKISPFIRLRA